jgi:hypothetical protein
MALEEGERGIPPLGGGTVYIVFVVVRSFDAGSAAIACTDIVVAADTVAHSLSNGVAAQDLQCGSA